LWAGIFGDILIGPHVLPHRLTGKHDQYYLLPDLSKLLEDVPLAVRERMWYMHEGAPAHCSRAVRDILNNTYHDRWVGRGGSTASITSLPVGAPENPCVCSSRWQRKELHLIVDACQTIHNYPDIFKRTWRSMMRSVEEWI
jgi:hypothetical protein